MIHSKNVLNCIRRINEINAINLQKKPSIAIQFDGVRKTGQVNLSKKGNYKSFKKAWCVLKEGSFYIFSKEKVSYLWPLSTLLQYYKAKTPSVAAYLPNCSVKSSRPPNEKKKDKYFYFEFTIKKKEGPQLVLKWTVIELLTTVVCVSA